MSNTNCLEGIKCPDCENESRFFIVSTITADVTDDGSEIADNRGDFEWDDDSPAECPECDRKGRLSEFSGDAGHPPPNHPAMAYHAKSGSYWIAEGSNGTEDTFTIFNPEGESLADVLFWDDGGERRAEAEAKAKLITDALNAYVSPSNTAT